MSTHYLQSREPRKLKGSTPVTETPMSSFTWTEYVASYQSLNFFFNCLFQQITRDELCLTVPAHRNYKVANHKAVPVTVYDYYNRQQTARMFYEPTLARSCDICDGDECGSSCNEFHDNVLAAAEGSGSEDLRTATSDSTRISLTIPLLFLMLLSFYSQRKRYSFNMS